MAVDPKAMFLARFGLGPRPGDLVRLGRDVRDAARAEIAAGISQPEGQNLRTTAELMAAWSIFDAEQRAARDAPPPPRQPSAPVPAASSSAPAPTASVPPQPGGPMPAAPPPGARPATPQPAPNMPQLPQRTYMAEVETRLAAARDPLVGIGERLVFFWSNHFCVSIAKGGYLRHFAGAFEREAIRPHVLGRFSDMLRAVESHPAMLNFLDNHASIGPNSPAGKRRGRGLNENLAREILELHTLGVGSGYSQADVTSLARIITGWAPVGLNEKNIPPGGFRFNPNVHEPGTHVLLGRSYADSGVEQGRAALDDMARHPSTARHIAAKLARHFIADDPPPALVASLAKEFIRTDGNLELVTLALLDAPEALEAPPTKIRSPQEFFIATARATGLRPNIGQILGPLRAMGQDIWGPGGPDGYKDINAAWAHPEGLRTRLDVALRLVRLAPAIDPRDFLKDLLGGASDETTTTIRRAESRAQGLALALMSPEFQRR